MKSAQDAQDVGTKQPINCNSTRREQATAQPGTTRIHHTHTCTRTGKHTHAHTFLIALPVKWKINFQTIRLQLLLLATRCKLSPPRSLFACRVSNSLNLPPLLALQCSIFILVSFILFYLPRPLLRTVCDFITRPRCQHTSGK